MDQSHESCGMNRVEKSDPIGFELSTQRSLAAEASISPSACALETGDDLGNLDSMGLGVEGREVSACHISSHDRRFDMMDLESAVEVHPSLVECPRSSWAIWS